MPGRHHRLGAPPPSSLLPATEPPPTAPAAPAPLLHLGPLPTSPPTAWVLHSPPPGCSTCLGATHTVPPGLPPCLSLTATASTTTTCASTTPESPHCCLGAPPESLQALHHSALAPASMLTCPGSPPPALGLHTAWDATWPAPPACLLPPAWATPACLHVWVPPLPDSPPPGCHHRTVPPTHWVPRAWASMPGITPGSHLPGCHHAGAATWAPHTASCLAPACALTTAPPLPRPHPPAPPGSSTTWSHLPASRHLVSPAWMLHHAWVPRLECT
ncbi:hypothetical protein GPJ56_007219 [Histomonas meleagridis]|nr:hypothetical protein GPJ56_007219 [Histomonas meleagridis]